MNTKEKQIKQWFEDWHYTILQQTIPIIEKGMEQKVMFNDFNKLNQVINLFLSTGTTTKYNYRESPIYIIILKCLRNLIYYFNFDLENAINTLESTLIKKNRDYGSSFDKSINRFGWVYAAIELNKKKDRLHSLIKNKSKPNYEGIEDTLLDIAGYCVLSLVYIENYLGREGERWTLPKKAYDTAYSKIKALDTKDTLNHFNIKEDPYSSTGLIVELAKNLWVSYDDYFYSAFIELRYDFKEDDLSIYTENKEYAIYTKDIDNIPLINFIYKNLNEIKNILKEMMNEAKF